MPDARFTQLPMHALTLAQSAPALPRPPFRPFLDPLELHSVWWLMLIPMALGVSLVYKAVRVKDLAQLPRQVLVMTLQIILGMIGLAVASYLVVVIFAHAVASRGQ